MSGTLELLTTLEAAYFRDGKLMPFRQVAQALRAQGPTARTPDVPGLLVPALDLWSFLDGLEAEKARTAYSISECLELLARDSEASDLSSEWRRQAAEFRSAAFAPPQAVGTISGKLKLVLLSKLEIGDAVRQEMGKAFKLPAGIHAANQEALGEGLVCLDRSGPLEALAAFRYAATLCPLDKRAHAGMGYAYELRGMWSHARECYRQALDRDADFTLARRGAVRVGLGLKDYQESAADLDRLFQRQDYSIEDRELAARYYGCVGDREMERKICERILEADSGNADAALCVAGWLLGGGRREEAEETLWTALQHDPVMDGLWLMLGRLPAPLTRDQYRRTRRTDLLTEIQKELPPIRRAMAPIYLAEYSSRMDVQTVSAVVDADSPRAAATAGLTRDRLLPLAEMAHREGLRLAETKAAQAKPLLLFAIHAYNCSAKRDAAAAAEVDLAEVGRRLGQPVAASHLARFALETAEEIGDGQLAANAHQVLARSLRQLGQLEAATQHFARAIDHQEEVRRRIVGPDARSLFTGSRAAAYAEQVLTLLDLGRPEYALDYVERAKSREMIDLLGNHKLNLRSNADRETLERDERLQHEVAYLEAVAREQNQRLQDLQWAQTSGEVDRAGQQEVERCRRHLQSNADELGRVRHELAAVKQQLRDSSEEWTSLRVVKPLPFADAALPTDLQRQLTAMLGGGTDRTVILEYFVTDEGTAIFLVPCWEGAPQRLMVARSGLERATIVRLVREDFQQAFHQTSDPPLFLEHLYTALMAPVATQLSDWGADVLLFAPHGPLHALPLHAMCYPDAQGAPRFLIEDYACGYAPSLSVLSLLQRKRQERGAGAFVAGNPTGDLIDAEDEARTVADLFGTKACVGEEVTEERVRAEVVDKDLVHLACHGHFEPQDALQSHLALADGVLQVDEVLDMSIRASLVTLSACSSGVSRVSGGDELNGMTRAWLYAGSPSVIASLWDVESGTTSRLMTTLYRNWRGAGHSKARALQMAQTTWLDRHRSAGRKSPDESVGHSRDWCEEWHPARWAAFILVGDPV